MGFEDFEDEVFPDLVFLVAIGQLVSDLEVVIVAVVKGHGTYFDFCYTGLATDMAWVFGKGAWFYVFGFADGFKVGLW